MSFDARIIFTPRMHSYDIINSGLTIRHINMVNNINNQIITLLLKRRFATDLTHRFSTIDQFAAGMQISTKKLQRLLNQENTTFSSELNTYRKQKAEELICHSKFSFSTIAHTLGYSSTEALNTACKRWFACSPSHLRKINQLKSQSPEANDRA